METESHHHQVAALPYRKRRGRMEILLITSRESKRWVIPKGWPMEGRTDYNAAKQEAFEEAGVKGRIGKMQLGHYIYTKRLNIFPDFSTKGSPILPSAGSPTIPAR